MEIKQINIENYRGKNFDFQPDRVNLFFKENGAGKTSLCDAIRYGITGLIPKDDVRNTSVRILYANGLNTERSRSKLTSCRLAGKKVTEMDLNRAIVDAIHIPLEDIKVVSSSEVFSKTKPEDLLRFLMKYIPEQLDFDTVMHYFSELTDEIVDECSLIFPAMPKKFDIGQVEKAHEYFYAERRDLNAVLQRVEGFLNNLQAVEPDRTLEEINQDITNLAIQEKEMAEFEKKLREYNESKQKRETQDQRIKDLSQKIEKIGKTEKPDEKSLKALEEKRKDADKQKLQASTNLATVKNNIQLFERTLNGLNTQKCPVSEKLICTTDKFIIKTEMTELLEKNRLLQADFEKKFKEQDTILVTCATDKSRYEEKKRTYDILQRLHSELKVYKDNLTIVPDRPEMQVVPAVIAQRKANLLRERKNFEEFEKKKAVQEEVQELTLKTKIYDYIVNALGDKGEVKKQILGYYLSTFSGVCNACAKDFAPGFEFQFLAEDGAKIMVKIPESKDFNGLDALSNGEHIIATFILMDMLNQLSDAKLLFIDNVEALDKRNLIYLKNLIENPEFQNRYDHIFICGVNHESIEEIFNDMIATFL